MPLLIELPGAKKRLEAQSFKTAAACVRIIEHGKGAYATGDNGCINVWRDKKGILRAHVVRFRETVESERFTGYAGLAYWLRLRLKEIRKPNKEFEVMKRQLFAGHLSALGSPTK